MVDTTAFFAWGTCNVVPDGVRRWSIGENVGGQKARMCIWNYRMMGMGNGAGVIWVRVQMRTWEGQNGVSVSESCQSCADLAKSNGACVVP